MEAVSCFDSAAAYLPSQLRKPALMLPESARVNCEEIRLRCGHYPTIQSKGKEKIFSGCIVDKEIVDMVVQAATRASPQTLRENIKWGYIPLEGGHRLGICGTAIIENGKISGFRKISSLNLRISRDIRGLAEPLIGRLYDNGSVVSTLIVAPPGVGKTTFLRDLIRCVSDGDGVESHRVGVVDERCEIVGRHYIGACTDVIENCPKAEGAITLLRGMNPQAIAVDEISALDDRRILEECAECGVSIFATIHGSDIKSLDKLEKSRFFKRVVFISIGNNERKYEVRRLEDDD